MDRSDLIKDHNHGGMSSSKLWFHVANTMATLIVGYKAYADTLSDSMFIWYLAIVGGATITSKLVGKLQPPQSKKPDA